MDLLVYGLTPLGPGNIELGPRPDQDSPGTAVPGKLPGKLLLTPWAR